MTQALAAFNEYGIVLATDSRATRFDAQGRPEYFTVEKLFPLGQFAAILSGGAGVGVPLSLALRHEVERQGLNEVTDVVDLAIPFLSEAYARYLTHHAPQEEGLRRLYFILAGFCPSQPPPGFKLFLLASEEQELPFKSAPVGNILVMPRNLGMEMRLFKTLQAGATLDELLKMSREFLEKTAAAQNEVGPPFYFAFITPDGYQPVEG